MSTQFHEIYQTSTYQRLPNKSCSLKNALEEVSSSKLNSMNSAINKTKESFDEPIYTFELDRLRLSSDSTVFDSKTASEDVNLYSAYDDLIDTEDEFNDQQIGSIKSDNDEVLEDVVEEEEEEEEEVEDVFDNNGFFYPPWNPKIRIDLERAYMKYCDRLPEIEYEEFWDPVMVSEYSAELLEVFRDNDYKYSVDPDSIQRTQTELCWDDRKYLIQRIIKLHYRFRLTLETLYLTVNIVDRFLSVSPVCANELELLGSVALFIAAKYEEVHPPNMEQLLYCSGNSFDASAVRKAESYVISALNFELNFVGPLSFLRRVSKADNYDLQTRTFAKYFLELTIMDHRFIGAPMSWLAAGATYISKKILQPESKWTAEHVVYSGYTEDQLEPLMEVIKDCCIKYEQHHKILYWKYSDKKYQKCSLYVQKVLSKDTPCC